MTSTLMMKCDYGIIVMRASAQADICNCLVKKLTAFGNRGSAIDLIVGLLLYALSTSHIRSHRRPAEHSDNGVGHFV